MSDVVRTRRKPVGFSEAELFWIRILNFAFDRLDEFAMLRATGQWKYTRKAKKHRNCVECGGKLTQDEPFICKSCFIRLEAGGER